MVLLGTGQVWVQLLLPMQGSTFQYTHTYDWSFIFKEMRSTILPDFFHVCDFPEIGSLKVLFLHGPSIIITWMMQFIKNNYYNRHITTVGMRILLLNCKKRLSLTIAKMEDWKIERHWC